MGLDFSMYNFSCEEMEKVRNMIAETNVKCRFGNSNSSIEQKIDMRDEHNKNGRQTSTPKNVGISDDGFGYRTPVSHSAPHGFPSHNNTITGPNRGRVVILPRIGTKQRFNNR